MAAVLAKGETVITKCCNRTRGRGFCNCLISMGAKIEGIGTSSNYIDGVTNLKTNYEIISDRIEVCTFIIAAAITKSHLSIQKLTLNHIISFLNVMKEMGLKFKIEKNCIEVFESGKLKPISLKTSAYPGFPTDMQAQIVTLACLSKEIQKFKKIYLKIDLCIFQN